MAKTKMTKSPVVKVGLMPSELPPVMKTKDSTLSKKLGKPAPKLKKTPKSPPSIGKM